MITPDIVAVDCNSLARRIFLKAVAAAAGRGSLEMNAEEEDLRKLAPSAPTHAEALRSGRLILVAEDNETNRKVIVRQLALLGYAADVADDGRAALECWLKGDYALLLTDLHMPRMDGYELTQAIRAVEKKDKRIPIIALTANALKGEADHCRALGMDDYRSKPSPLAELKAVLDKWLPAARPQVDASAVSPAAPVVSQHAVPVDVSVLKALIGDEPVLIRDFLQDFRTSAAGITQDLRAAFAAGQPSAAIAAAHKLKSSARAVGASVLGDLCAAIEEEGKAGNKDVLAALLSRFEVEMALVDKYLLSL